MPLPYKQARSQLILDKFNEGDSLSMRPYLAYIVRIYGSYFNFSKPIRDEWLKIRFSIVVLL